MYTLYLVFCFSSVCVYHGQDDLCLVQDWLREHGQVDTLRYLNCSSIQVSNNNIQLVDKTQNLNLKMMRDLKWQIT